MLKYVIFIIYASIVVPVFSENGYDDIKESRLSRNEASAIKTSERTRIQGLGTTDLQSKDSYVISPLYEQSLEDQPSKADVNSIASSEVAKDSEKCHNGNCIIDSDTSPMSLTEDRTVRNTEYYDNSNANYDRDQYYDNRHPPPPPPPYHRDRRPPPFHDNDRPPPTPPGHREGPPPPRYHRGPPPLPPRHGGSRPPPPNEDYYHDQYSYNNYYNRPPSASHGDSYRRNNDDRLTRQSYRDNPRYNSGRPPPPSHHGGPPPPSPYQGHPPPRSRNYGGPPPSNHHTGPPPQRHGDGPPPPRHHNGPPLHHYQDRGPPPRYHDGPPPSHHRDGPPPSHDHDGPPPAHDHDWPSPNRGQPPPPRFQNEGPPSRFEENRPPPRFKENSTPLWQQPDLPSSQEDDLPPAALEQNMRDEAYDERPARQSSYKQNENRAASNKPAKLVDASHDTRHSSDSLRTEAQNDDQLTDKYTLNVRFANDEPVQTTLSPFASKIKSRLSPYLFQAVPVRPEED